MLSKDSKNINIKIDNPEKLKITIVVSEWHSEITDKLFKGAKNVLTDNGLLEENINRVNVPGSFELIYGCRMAQNNNQDAVIAIGCIVKGETPHFDFISQASTDAIMKLSIESKKPIGNGIITCLNMTQARARRRKGAEAALAVLSVLSQK